MKKSMALGLTLLAVGGLVAFTYAQEHKDSHGKQDSHAGPEHSANAEQDPHAGHDHSAHAEQEAEQGAEGEAAMWEAFAKASTPGTNHHHLSPLVGKWDAVGKFRFTPEAPWQQSRSKAEFTWIMGGRFLTQEVFGEPMMAQMPSFEGFGVIGYDNSGKKYNSFWVDNYGTMMMMGEGTCDAAGTTFTFKSTFTDPMSGQPTWMRSVYKIEGNDRFVLSMYGPDPTGKEFLTMEITNTRSGTTKPG